MSREFKILIAVFALLWAAFAGTGVALHISCRDAEKNNLNWVDISAYDSEGYLTHFTIIQAMFQVMPRHPGLGVVCLPHYVFGSMVAEKKGCEAGSIAVLIVAGAIGAVTWLLLWLVLKKSDVDLFGRIAASCLWLCFAHVWVLGGVAESFPIAQALLLGTLLMVAYGVKDRVAWAALSVVSGAVTITNVVKPPIAWFCGLVGFSGLRKLTRRQVIFLAALPLGGFAALFLYGVIKWVFVHKIGIVAGLGSVVKGVLEFLPDAIPLKGRLWYTWQSFFCEPICLHGSVIAHPVAEGGYATWLPHVVVATILGLSAWSAIRNWWRPLVRAIVGMISFDFALHLVLGWGINEGQLYCGHWFWALPILIALLPRKAVWVGMCVGVVAAIHNVCIVAM